LHHRKICHSNDFLVYDCATITVASDRVLPYSSTLYLQWRCVGHDDSSTTGRVGWAGGGGGGGGAPAGRRAAAASRAREEGKERMEKEDEPEHKY
jgi:hypothetical protein